MTRPSGNKAVLISLLLTQLFLLNTSQELTDKVLPPSRREKERKDPGKGSHPSDLCGQKPSSIDYTFLWFPHEKSLFTLFQSPHNHHIVILLL